MDDDDVVDRNRRRRMGREDGPLHPVQLPKSRLDNTP